VLSVRERQQLDFATPEYRASLLVLISQIAPAERRCRRLDWAMGVVGSFAVAASVAVLARWGFDLIWLAVAIINAITLHRHALRAFARRREWRWLCDVGDYLIAGDAVADLARRDLPDA